MYWAGVGLLTNGVVEVHGVNTALKTHTGTQYAELQNLKETEAQWNKWAATSGGGATHSSESGHRWTERSVGSGEVLGLPSETPESTEAPCRRISLRWSHRPAETMSWRPHLKQKQITIIIIIISSHLYRNKLHQCEKMLKFVLYEVQIRKIATFFYG